jgi:hypothetical protein
MLKAVLCHADLFGSMKFCAAFEPVSLYRLSVGVRDRLGRAALPRESVVESPEALRCMSIGSLASDPPLAERAG